MEKPNPNHVNIEEMLGPKLRKKMPRFLINYLKKIVHESEMNEAIDKSNGLSGPEFFKYALSYLDITYTVIGEENLPKDGKYILRVWSQQGSRAGSRFVVIDQSKKD